MQISLKKIFAILPALASTAFASCYMAKPAWTDLATEEQIFKAFRNSCERMQGKHAGRVSTCDSANGDVMSREGGSYFLYIEPYAKGEWNLSVDTCLLLAGELHRMCDHGGVKNITAGWSPTITALVELEPKLGCCGC